MEPRVLVIGGGIAGMTSAVELAEHGVKVTLLEKEGVLGGKAVTYCCKATDRCQKCFACFAHQIRVRVERHPGVEVKLRAEVVNAEEEGDGFRFQVKTPTGLEEVEVKAVIVATGFTPFDVRKRRQEYGYGRSRRVITGLDLERILQEKGNLTAVFGPVRKIGFIQCVGSRDLAYEKAGYCSRVCCMYTLRLSRLLRAELPEADIAVFYMDLQTFGRGYDRLLKEITTEDRIRLIRGIPAKTFLYPGERLTVKYADTLTGEIIEEKMDVLVLAAAVTPPEDATKLAELLGIERDSFGFFKGHPAYPWLSSRERVFLAGACQAPKDIFQSILQAKAAASAALQVLTAKV